MAADPNPMQPDRNTSSGNPGEFLGLGLQFAGSILLFLFLGRWLDERLGTAPWLLLLGVFVGFGLGFLFLYRKLTSGSSNPNPSKRQ